MFKRNITKSPNKKKTGQSTVEYIILVAAIIALLLVFLSKNGIFQTAFNSTLSTGTSGMNAMANKLANSRFGVPPGP